MDWTPYKEEHDYNYLKIEALRKIAEQLEEFNKKLKEKKVKTE